MITEKSDPFTAGLIGGKDNVFNRQRRFFVFTGAKAREADNETQYKEGYNKPFAVHKKITRVQGIINGLEAASLPIVGSSYCFFFTSRPMEKAFPRNSPIL